MRLGYCAPLCASLVLAAACVELERTLKPEPQSATAPKPPAAPPDPTVIVEAFSRLNRAFQQDYERILNERGVRSFQARRSEAFDALHAGLTRLGMIVESRDPDAGTLTVAAPAPRPLSADEWRRTIEADLPMMQMILCPQLGESYCRAIKFEPDDYVIVINATVLGTAKGGSEVSLTTRMREIAPRPGMPRREYPPPTGVRMALDKIWAQFDRELAEQERRGARKAP
jgi:hypothetical protein